MRAWTVHAPLPPAPAPRASVPPAGAMPVGAMPEAPPRRGRLVLVPEGFSWLAALLPPLWFLMHRLWLVLLLWLALAVLAAVLLPAAVTPYVLIAAQILIGLQAQDLRRWSLARRGLPVAAVVLGGDEEAALLRALDRRPELAAVEGGRA
ncbi:DUF2628 domain-containing protein [Roseomonas sp. KE0001]|uniref:DUF2628 domain-containing protein n=1 Tax=Roseomonas sp. KE0001 TaxID=2479201 RepID=UPI0018DF1DEF|nr:DUF2628 domain-containing protein [Roseomonas sp. KE0001]MBI0434795.1 DUF2628 domain-containing protein [Roseomonas sp. KE0001]